MKFFKDLFANQKVLPLGSEATTTCISQAFRAVHISCHKHRSKHLNFHYIYPISYKIAKKANPEKGFAQIEKRYHRF